MYPTTGYTPSVSKQELDDNYLATLEAMVAEYPDNTYWENLLTNELNRLEAERDANWLSDEVLGKSPTTRIPQTAAESGTVRLVHNKQLADTNNKFKPTQKYPAMLQEYSDTNDENFAKRFK